MIVFNFCFICLNKMTKTGLFVFRRDFRFEDNLSLVELSKEYNTGLDVRVLLMRVDTRTKDTNEMLDYLKEQGLNVLSSRVCERVAFRRAIGEGAIAQEIGKDPSATAEMEAFFKEVTA